MAKIQFPPRQKPVFVRDPRPIIFRDPAPVQITNEMMLETWEKTKSQENTAIPAGDGFKPVYLVLPDFPGMPASEHVSMSETAQKVTPGGPIIETKRTVYYRSGKLWKVVTTAIYSH